MMQTEAEMILKVESIVILQIPGRDANADWHIVCCLWVDL